MVDLYAQLPELRAELQEYIESNNDTNADGEILDSDEDEDGNLRGFVVDEDGEEGDEEEEGEEGDDYEEVQDEYGDAEGGGGFDVETDEDQ